MGGQGLDKEVMTVVSLWLCVEVKGNFAKIACET